MTAQTRVPGGRQPPSTASVHTTALSVFKLDDIERSAHRSLSAGASGTSLRLTRELTSCHWQHWHRDWPGQPATVCTTAGQGVTSRGHSSGLRPRASAGRGLGASVTWMLLLRDYQGHQLAATGPLLGGGRWRARIAVTHAVPQALLTTGTGMSSLSDLGLSRTLKIDDCQAIRRA